MKTSFTTLLLIGEATAGAISLRHVTRQTTQGCCFSLDSAGTVTEDVDEDHTGGLHLGGTFQDGEFCLKDGKIKDWAENSCFIKGPDYAFQCYQQGVDGDTVFDIETSSDGKTKLTYDDAQDIFLACPTDGEDSYDIYPKSKPDTTGCLEVSLVLSNQTGDCPASTSTSTTNGTSYSAAPYPVSSESSSPISDDEAYPVSDDTSYPVSDDTSYPVTDDASYPVSDDTSYPVEDASYPEIQGSCARAVAARAAEPRQ